MYPGSVWPNCRPRVISCLRRCPWNFERVIVYAWYEWHYLIGLGTEAGLLIELLACLTILLQGAPDSLDSVRGCYWRMGCLSKKATLYFCRKGRSVLFRTKGAVCVSIDCYNPTRSWHFELEVCRMRYRIESSKCGSPEQRVITTAERDYIKD